MSKRKQDKRISLDPLNFDQALIGLLQTEPPSKIEGQEDKKQDQQEDKEQGRE